MDMTIVFCILTNICSYAMIITNKCSERDVWII